jgi:hypothetical protein
LFGKSKIKLIKKDGSEIIAQVVSGDKAIVTTATGLTTTISSHSSPLTTNTLMRTYSEPIRVHRSIENHSIGRPPEKLIEMRLNSNQKGISLISPSSNEKVPRSSMRNEHGAPTPPTLLFCPDRFESAGTLQSMCASPDHEFDPIDILDWKNGIGSLPGSGLRFKLNEFGSLEMVDDTEVDEIVQCLNAKLNEDPLKSDHAATNPTDFSVCSHCGVQGVLSTFVRKGRFCTQSCALQHSARLRSAKVSSEDQTVGKRKLSDFGKQMRARKLPPGSIKSEPTSADELQVRLALENVPDVKTLVTERPGIVRTFVWRKYLLQTQSCAVPFKCFRPCQANGDRKNHFKINQKLEGIDPQHPSLFCVLTVMETIGMRLRLRFDGYDSVHDFWTYADSPFIFPAGWCSRTNRKLQPPKNMQQFDWSTYLMECEAKAAPESIFYWASKQITNSPGIKVGMKLEAVDRANTSLVCVASVSDIIGNWLLIHFDGWDDSYDYWTESSSPYIHPINWCRARGKSLTPPKDYPRSSEKFSWEKYLNEKSALFVPPRAFCARPANKFKPGMKLEVTDKRNPRCVRVATIVNRQSHSVKIHFDNWDTKYDYWIDDDSPDLHPVNWCHKTGQCLEEPPTIEFESLSIYNHCSTFGCKGIGNRLDAGSKEHLTLNSCPYTDEHLDYEPNDRLGEDGSDDEMDDEFADRPISLDSPMSSACEIKEMQNGCSNQSYDSDHDSRSITPSSDVTMAPIQQSMAEVRSRLQQFEEAPMGWNQHSKHLYDLLGPIQPHQLLTWSHRRVCELVSNLPGCEEFAGKFESERIDGEAFLLLTQNDLVKILGIKLGPAIKIYNSILLLRKLMSEEDSM